MVKRSRVDSRNTLWTGKGLVTAGVAVGLGVGVAPGSKIGGKVGTAVIFAENPWLPSSNN